MPGKRMDHWTIRSILLTSANSVCVPRFLCCVVSSCELFTYLQINHFTVSQMPSSKRQSAPSWNEVIRNDRSVPSKYLAHPVLYQEARRYVRDWHLKWLIGQGLRAVSVLGDAVSAPGTPTDKRQRIAPFTPDRVGTTGGQLTISPEANQLVPRGSSGLGAMEDVVPVDVTAATPSRANTLTRKVPNRFGRIRPLSRFGRPSRLGQPFDLKRIKRRR